MCSLRLCDYVAKQSNGVVSIMRSTAQVALYRKPLPALEPSTRLSSAAVPSGATCTLQHGQLTGACRGCWLVFSTCILARLHLFHIAIVTTCRTVTCSAARLPAVPSTTTKGWTSGCGGSSPGETCVANCRWPAYSGPGYLTTCEPDGFWSAVQGYCQPYSPPPSPPPSRASCGAGAHPCTPLSLRVHSPCSLGCVVCCLCVMMVRVLPVLLCRTLLY